MIELKNYPEAKKLFSKWAAGRYKLVLGVELTDEDADKFADLVIQSNHRILSDFLDEQEIRMTVEYRIEEKGGYWHHNISPDSSTEYTSRIAAEIAGFNRALELFEKGLNQKERV